MTHTSGFNAAWAKNNSKFSLPDTHKFRIKSGTATVIYYKIKPAPDSSSAVSSLTGYFIKHAGALAQQNGDNTKAVLEHYKSNEEDSDMPSFVADLQTDWGLN